jgi:hypothetical protein
MSPGLLAETKTLSLDAGTKIVVVGANDAGVSKFRVAGADRHEFMSVGDAKQATTLHGKNISFVIMNGRIPPEVQDHVQTLADRANAQAVYVTASGGALLRMMEDFPLRNKGVITFEVPEVIRVIELKAPRPPRPPQPPPPPPEPPKPPQPPGSQPPPPKPLDQPLTLAQLLDRLEQLYDQFGGDHKKVIAHFRDLGFGDSITGGALYQRCLTIRNRRAKKSGNVAAAGIAVPVELLASGKGQELLAAIESAKASQQRVLELAAEVAAENVQLKGIAERQANRLKGLPALEAEVSLLREKAEAARKLFAAASPQ